MNIYSERAEERRKQFNRLIGGCDMVLMKNIYLPLIALLLFVFAVEMVNVGKQEQLSDMRHAYSVCWQAHQVDWRISSDCAKAQTATHTEFLCNDDTTNSHCWLEVK